MQVQLDGGQQCWVALCVLKVGLQWQVVLQPSFRLINKAAGAVYVYYTGQLVEGATSQKSRRGLTAGSSFALQPESKVKMLESFGKAALSMVLFVSLSISGRHICRTVPAV